jgi:hypothetical protein
MGARSSAPGSATRGQSMASRAVVGALARRRSVRRPVTLTPGHPRTR